MFKKILIFAILWYNCAIKERRLMMKVYKKRLPEGVRKQFALEKGIKVKVLNSLYYDKKKKNTSKEK